MGHLILNFGPRFLSGSEARSAEWGVGAPLEGPECPQRGGLLRHHLGPWAAGALLLGHASPGSGTGAAAARRPRRFWLRCGSWHWAPRGQTPLREKSGHSSVCFFLHCGEKAQLGEASTCVGRPARSARGRGRGRGQGRGQGVRVEASCGRAVALRPQQPHLACVPIIHRMRLEQPKRVRALPLGN